MKISFLVWLNYDRKMRSVCYVKVKRNENMAHIQTHAASISTILLQTPFFFKRTETLWKYSELKMKKKHAALLQSYMKYVLFPAS